ncbi:hypothetical protein Ancab_013107 [Ancistrocladus abbreviatus]
MARMHSRWVEMETPPWWMVVPWSRPMWIISFNRNRKGTGGKNHQPKDQKHRVFGKHLMDTLSS